jgi:hypothetical protein
VRDRIRNVRRALLVTTVSMLALPAHVPAHAAGGADLRIDSVQASVTSGPVGTTVTFRIVAENAGPDPITSSLDVGYDDPMSIHTRTFDGYDGSRVNFDIVSETCAWDGFGGVGPSPDTPFCEFGPTAAGDTVYVEIVATIARTTPSRIAALGFRVTNEAAEFDPDLMNNTAIVRVRITR